METSLGFSHFIVQADALSKTVLLLLLALSLASWYLILTKAVSNVLDKQRAEEFLAQFWAADSLPQIRHALLKQPRNHAFAQLAHDALDAASDNEKHGMQKLAAAGGLSEFLTRLLRNGIDQEAARVEHGLTILASAGSSAPYVGLFGTVWGIYHALVNIGLSGQGTLDKVSGPVGEALIMTALGLAVAIPAVLAYNAFNRRNRVWLAKLDAFAHDLYAIITVGEKSNTSASGEVRPLQSARMG
ncbi:MAG TPA: MotA/TolQ/ExbB proton channel family protein [Thiobacillaceae bacterium]|nr:MotA/TolQ/ExbB proton channel family protein [Thiobacillaceae bacterium]